MCVAPDLLCVACITCSETSCTTCQKRAEGEVWQFAGHLNSETVKGVSFMGVEDEYVVSGSDCGHIYFWSKEDGKLQQLVKGDRHVVNCLEPHPFLPATLATSGQFLVSDLTLNLPVLSAGLLTLATDI